MLLLQSDKRYFILVISAVIAEKVKLDDIVVKTFKKKCSSVSFRHRVEDVLVLLGI